MASLLYEGLFRLDQTFTPQSLLCASYTYDPETLTYKLTLRDGVVFSDGALYSEHVQSAVRDTHYGLSDALVIDGDHSDYIVNVGCIYAGEVYGAVLERLEDGQTVGFGGLSLEMEQTGNEEPAVVMTGDDGRFDFSGILPGRYDAVLTLSLIHI